MRIPFFGKKNKDSGLDLKDLEEPKFDLEKESNEKKRETDILNDDPFKKNYGDDYDSFGNKRIPEGSRTSEFTASKELYENQYRSDDKHELILAKLDAIKAEVNNISHRLENLERNKKRLF